MENVAEKHHALPLSEVCLHVIITSIDCYFLLFSVATELEPVYV